MSTISWLMLVLIFPTVFCDTQSFNTTGTLYNGTFASEVCQADVCQLKAQDIKNSVNTSANPCDDFYAYACGKYIANHKPPAFYFVDSLSPRVTKAKLDILNSTEATNFYAGTTARRLYAQCTDDEQREKLGTRPLLDTLDRLIGGWPLLQKNWSANASLNSIFVSAFYSQQPILLRISVENSLYDASKYWIEIDEPTEIYSRDVLSSERGEGYTKEYLDWVTTIATDLVGDANSSVNVNSTEFQKDVTSIVDFGRTIILAKKTAEQKTDLTDNKAETTLGALQRAKNFQSALLSNFTDFVRTLFIRANISHLITAETPVVAMSPNYLTKVDEKLRELESAGAEGKRRLANYIGWKIIAGNRDWLPKKYRTKFTGDTQSLCMQYVTSTMPLAINEMYAKYLNASDIITEKATIFARYLQSSLTDLLAETPWLDNATRSYAQEKLRNIQFMVGYRSKPEIRQRIDDLYKNIDVRANFFETLQAVTESETVRNMAKLGTMWHRDDPLDNAYDNTQINAAYEPVTNTLYIPLSILQMPLFYRDVPEAVIYGATGFTVGHEFTHGFDTQGSLFGKLGGLTSWWSNETLAVYKERAKSLVDQYNRYSLDVGSVNGQLTLTENIADNGGLKVAFKALRKALQSVNTTASLPGLEQFTAEQLFFLSTATAWCEIRTGESYRMKLLTSVHAVPQFRINGAMSNMPEFAQAFGCPLGSYMNPQKKNGVW